MGWYDRVDVSVMIGKTIIDITNNYDDELIFKTNDGETFKMYHDQDCCETVSIEDICGNLADLIDTPILMAEEVSEDDLNASESGTWTFYKFGTIKGYVTIRWYGTSNGYYSESVDFKKINSKGE